MLLTNFVLIYCSIYVIITISNDEFNERQKNCNVIVNDKKFHNLANDVKGKFHSYFYHELELNPLPQAS